MSAAASAVARAVQARLDRLAVRWLMRHDPKLVADLHQELGRTKWWEPDVVDKLSRTLTLLGETPEQRTRTVSS